VGFLDYETREERGRMKRTVFIASTYQDLASHRNKVWDLLEEFEVNVRGMEEFGARTEAPLDTCLAEVEQADIFVGIIAFRLGSVHEGSGKSFTQLEYERAHELSKEILIYLMDEEHARVAPKFVDHGFTYEKLESFKRILQERHTVDTFVSEDDLVEKLRRDFRRLLQSKEPADERALDEFSEAAKAIEKFLLIPKATSGKEVRLQVRVKDKPFPASRAICDVFNLEFGSTIGLWVEITNPEGFQVSGLNELFLSAKQGDSFLPVSIDETRDIYARLNFTDEAVQESRARFKREVIHLGGILDVMMQRSLLGGKRIEYEPDGRVIMLLTKSP
jgi:hypothetical protein